jgi:hypothetical protein
VEKINHGLPGLGKPCQNPDADDQGDAVANAAFRDLFTEPHEQQSAGCQDEHRLYVVPPKVFVEHQVSRKVGDESPGLKLTSKEESLSQAKKHRQITAVLNHLCASALFARQLAEPRHDGGEQLDDDGRADVRHDPHRPDRASLQRASGKHAVHIQQTAPFLGMSCILEKCRQLGPIQPRNGRHGNQPANPQQQQCEKYARLQLRDFEAVGEGVDEVLDHAPGFCGGRALAVTGF